MKLHKIFQRLPGAKVYNYCMFCGKKNNMSRRHCRKCRGGFFATRKVSR